MYFMYIYLYFCVIVYKYIRRNELELGRDVLICKNFYDLLAKKVS